MRCADCREWFRQRASHSAGQREHLARPVWAERSGILPIEEKALHARTKLLNDRRFDALHFTGPGTGEVGPVSAA